MVRWPSGCAENTHLLRKGKYHYTTDPLFNWFGFDKLVNLYLIKHKQSSWIQISQTGGHPIQYYFPLQSKWVFSWFSINVVVSNSSLGRTFYVLKSKVTELKAINVVVSNSAPGWLLRKGKSWNSLEKEMKACICASNVRPHCLGSLFVCKHLFAHGAL